MEKETKKEKLTSKIVDDEIKKAGLYINKTFIQTQETLKPKKINLEEMF